MSEVAKIIALLRRTHVETNHYEAVVGFMGREAETISQTVHANPDGRAAEALIESLLLYVAHDAGCSANDLDYLDRTPCTCGLRLLYSPKGIQP